jgi:hypothetical protein
MGYMKVNDSPPTLLEVVEKLQQLVSGRISREEASAWATPWVTKFDDFKFDDRDLDRKVKDAMRILQQRTPPTSDREYLFEKIDFEAWLLELSEAK